MIHLKDDNFLVPASHPWPICILMYLKMIIWQCDPYFDNSGCSHPGCEPGYPTPKCARKCVNKNLLWRESKRFSVSAYRIHSDPYNIMAEVYKNGPVEVAFTVYEVKEISVNCFSVTCEDVILLCKSIGH